MKTNILGFMSLVSVVVAVTLVSTAIAAPVTPEQFTKVSTSTRTLTSANRTSQALAGNITEVEITDTVITNGWQGYFGNITGTIVLDDANNNTFYSWNFITISGEVFASRNHSIDWSSGQVECANASIITTENTKIFPGTAADDSDNVTITFGKTTHPAFDVGSNSFSADDCNYAVSTFVDDAADTGRSFNETILYSKNQNGVIYTAIINSNTDGFKTGSSDIYDFQMLVGEDGHSNTLVTPYYFYVELTN